ncbi:MAG: hypothetical protein AAB217_18050, partial [Chloroflexota bacterium]
MRPASRSVIQIDWLLFSLRWLLLFAIAAEVFITSGGNLAAQWLTWAVLAAGAAGNALIAIFLFSRWWTNVAARLTLVADILLAIGLA